MFWLKNDPLPSLASERMEKLAPHLPSRIMVTVAMSGRRWCRRRRHQECSASSHDLRITVQMRIRCTNDVTYLWSNLDTPLDWKTITKWDMEISKIFKFSTLFFSPPVRKSIYDVDIILYKKLSWNFLEWETAGKANSYIYRSQHPHRTWIDGGIFIECLRTKWTAQNWAVPILNVVLEIWLM